MNDISYTNWSSMSDKALSETIGNFIRHHRLQQNRTQKEVANAADISRSTLSLLEKGGKVTLRVFIKVLRVLDLLYVMDVFKAKEEISPLEYIKQKQKTRKRAKGTKTEPENNLEW